HMGYFRQAEYRTEHYSENTEEIIQYAAADRFDALDRKRTGVIVRDDLGDLYGQRQNSGDRQAAGKYLADEVEAEIPQYDRKDQSVHQGDRAHKAIIEVGIRFHPDSLRLIPFPKGQ